MAGRRWQHGPVITEDFADTSLQPPLAISFAAGGSIAGNQLSDEAMPGSFAKFGSFNFGNGLTEAAIAVGGDWDLSPGGKGSSILLSAVFPRRGAGQQIGAIINPTGTAAAYSGFFGFVSDAPVYKVQYQGGSLTGNGEEFSLKNLSFVIAPFEKATPLGKPPLHPQHL